MNEQELIRLACISCDRDDFDGTHTLEEATALGWEGVEGVEEDEDSAGWWEYLGYCPGCLRRYFG